MKKSKTEISTSYTTPQKLCNIDFLRGIAAIAILLWHYQHLYFPEAGVNAIAEKREVQPLFGVFTWFYVYGSWAVEFFWILSGFVFFHVYEKRRNVSLRQFLSHRFSRLYPLHFLTLCLVAVLQFISWQWFQKFQIYPLNDLWHFVLNLFMASHWGFQKGWSFNAPIWSISVEILVYLMFFAFLKAVGVRPLTSLLWFAWSLLFYKDSPTPVFECAALFALGGVVNQMHGWLKVRSKGDFSAIGGISLFATSVLSVNAGWVSLATGVQWGIFPSLIWLAASLEVRGISSGALGLGLGNITYSSYLLHVPIQISIIMVLDGIVGSREVVSSPTFLLAYLLAVICTAALAYKFVELPLKLRCIKLIG
jgi:peptidoglycan/LPS O-acetylase OafA/YrhL